MKIAVIGAGVAGLVAIKHCIEYGHECEAFEQTEFIGGTWNYTDEVGFDKNGLPVHTSMYKNLRTNIPKEVMMFENFPYPDDVIESYITQTQVLQYLNDYAEKMNLRKYIKFHTVVTNVEPEEGNKWNIVTQNTKTKEISKKKFDAVVCCNGKYNAPCIPHIDGLETFKGNWIHSHDYRTTESYTNKTVLVIGGGPSGNDISSQLCTVAKKVYCSFKNVGSTYKFPEGCTKKPLVTKIGEDTVYFEDGSMENGIEEIILCTGFNITFPFLSEKCGMIVEDNFVKTGYKEMINANYPSMAILGIPAQICPFPTAEIQMRFFLAALTGNITLPSTKEMLEEIEDFKRRRNVHNRKVHSKTGELEREYFDDLAKTGNVRSVPLVITRLHDRVRVERNYNHRFRLIDDDNFIETQ